MNEPAHSLRAAGTALFDALAAGWPCVWMGAVPWLSVELMDARCETGREWPPETLTLERD